MQNPLAEGYDGDGADRDLARAAIEGSREALDQLVRRHQGFIHGLALRMLWNPRDAEDAAQEILIRLVTGLSSFRGESAFRTWAYRIAVNHLLNRRRGRAEELVGGFEDFGKKIDDLPDLDLEGEIGTAAERAVLVKETRAACLTGMLLCLDRAQRLTFVLGEVLEASDATGSDVLGITRQNYRQRLARARRQLHQFMRGKCGLADPKNPCRCARKTRGAIRAGIVDPRSLKFVPSHLARVERTVGERSRDLVRAVGEGYARLYRRQDLREPPDLVAGLHAILSDQRLRASLDLDDER